MKTTAARPLASAWAAWLVATGGAAWANEPDPLALPSAPVTSTTQPVPATKVLFEAMVGRAQQRFGLGDEDLRRLSLDLKWSARLSPAWRLSLSNRTDLSRPVASGSAETVNSLREAYASWRGADGTQGLDIGRLNLRQGPAYGFNPTDFLRDGTVRAFTSDDPVAQRENRLGTAMLHWQALRRNGAVSVAWAPKLADKPSRDGWSADLGSTNDRQRLLLTASMRGAGGQTAQALLYAAEHQGTQLGLNGTQLLAPSVVVHGEWSYGRDRLLLPAGGRTHEQRSRLSSGATWTAASGLAVTLEAQYNGFAPTDPALRSLLDNQPAAWAALQAEAQRRQENASRRALLLYLSQRNAFVRQLDLTGFLRVNAEDHSRLWWLEARYRWTGFDTALQWRMTDGHERSEFGLQARKQALQLVASAYF